MSIASIPHPRCQKILPAVYSDSLSYYEELCHLVAKINEVIETFNEYEEIIDRLANLSADIEGMEIDIATLKSQMLSAQSDINSLINNFDALVKEDGRLQSEIDALTAKVDSVTKDYENIIRYIDSAVARVKIENQAEWMKYKETVNTLLAEMRKQIADIMEIINELPNTVYNPVRGYREGFNKNNADIYQDLRYGGFTNAELSEFGVSNTHVASLVHNNRDYALHAKKRFKRHYVFSPVSGLEVSHANALSQVLDQIIGIMPNDVFYAYMAGEGLTNDDLSTLINSNFERITANLA